MPNAKPTIRSGAISWWLSEGDEECPHCGQIYIYELEFRCPECDGPCCHHCKVVHAEGHHVCPSCVKAAPVETPHRSQRHG